MPIPAVDIARLFSEKFREYAEDTGFYDLSEFKTHLLDQLMAEPMLEDKTYVWELYEALFGAVFVRKLSADERKLKVNLQFLGTFDGENPIAICSPPRARSRTKTPASALE